MLPLFFIVVSSATLHYADACYVRDILVTGIVDDCTDCARPTTTAEA